MNTSTKRCLYIVGAIGGDLFTMKAMGWTTPNDFLKIYLIVFISLVAPEQVVPLARQFLGDIIAPPSKRPGTHPDKSPVDKAVEDAGKLLTQAKFFTMSRAKLLACFYLESQTAMRVEEIREAYKNHFDSFPPSSVERMLSSMCAKGVIVSQEVNSAYIYRLP